MKTKYILLSTGIVAVTILGISLLFLSKWLILLDIIMIPFILEYFFPTEFRCSKCGHIQESHIVLNKEVDTQLTHGRVTNSGRLDKRYNSTFESTTYITYGINCEKCYNTFKITRIE